MSLQVNDDKWEKIGPGLWTMKAEYWEPYRIQMMMDAFRICLKDPNRKQKQALDKASALVGKAREAAQHG